MIAIARQHYHRLFGVNLCSSMFIHSRWQNFHSRRIDGCTGWRHTVKLNEKAVQQTELALGIRSWYKDTEVLSIWCTDSLMIKCARKKLSVIQNVCAIHSVQASWKYLAWQYGIDMFVTGHVHRQDCLEQWDWRNQFKPSATWCSNLTVKLFLEEHFCILLVLKGIDGAYDTLADP